MAFTICGGSTHQDCSDSLKDASVRILAGLYKDLLKKGNHRGDFDVSLTDHDENGNMTHAAAYLFPHRDDNGDLMLSMLSAPVAQT